jgi:hypothetical protein
MSDIFIPDVSERDIDLLLLEEAIASPRFTSWLLEQVGINEWHTLAEAHRSVKTGNGESDLELAFRGADGKVTRLIVENKIDAVFQPNQAKRYAERALTYLATGSCSGVTTLLLAPEVYFGGNDKLHGFDATLSYEAIIDWFSTQQPESDRRRYKVKLLSKAIDRGRTGWTLVPHPKVKAFWDAYWRLTQSIANQLAMPKPNDQIPEGSHFVVFRPPALPAGVTLKHKVGYGHVDLEFGGMGERLAELELALGQRLPAGAQLTRAAKSAAVRCFVEPVDMARDVFAAREAAVRQGITAAANLLAWYSATAQVQLAKSGTTGTSDGVKQISE